MHTRHLALLALAFVLAAAGCGSAELTAEVNDDAVTQAPTSSAPIPPTTTTTSTSGDVATSQFRCGPAGAEPATIGAAGRELGDVRQLQLRTRNVQQGGDATFDSTVTVEVTEVTDERTSLRWTSQASSLLGIEVSPELEEELGFAIDELPTQNIRYWIDDEGFFAGVENIEEIKTRAVETLDLIGDTMPDDQRVALTNIYQGLTADQVATTFAEATLLYHSLDGLLLEIGSNVEFDDVLPNSFGTEPFPATATLSVSRRTDDDNCTLVRLAVAPEPEAFARIMWESVETVFGGAPDEAEVIDQFDVSHVIEAAVDRATGTVISVTATETVSAMGETAKTITTITDVSPPR